MSPVKPYYLLSQRQLTHLEVWLQSTVVLLAKRWWSDISKVEVVVRLLDDVFAGKNVKSTYQLDDSYLLICGDDRQWTNAAGGWLGCDVDHPSTLTKALESKYCEELVASLDPAWYPSSSSVDTKEIIASYSRPASGGIAIDVMVNNFSHTLLTSAAAFPSIFETKDQSTNTVLLKVADALHASAVTLEARLAAVQVPIMDVSALQVGDFIDLRHDLSGEIFLNGISAEISLKAELGQCKNNKAVQLVSLNRK